MILFRSNTVIWLNEKDYFFTIWAKDSNNYHSYEDFKKSLDPNTKLWTAIKKETKSELRGEIGDLLRVRCPLDRPLHSAHRRDVKGLANRKYRR